MQQTLHNNLTNTTTSSAKEKKDRSSIEYFSLVSKYLSYKFISYYKINISQKIETRAVNHLSKIFTYLLQNKNQKINFLLTTNKKKIKLEFKVSPSYLKGENRNIAVNANTKVISIDQFYLKNFKYIII
tara:strand:- start:139 stop:525 length:387 start_codon:yes stop_codon:yes gene_type:complete